MFSSALRRRAILGTSGSLLAGSVAAVWPRGDNFVFAQQKQCNGTLVQRTLTSTTQNLRTEQWETSSDEARCRGPPWSLHKKTLHGGRQEGVDVITVDNGVLTISIVPTRGMSISKVTVRDSNQSVPLGWDSPVREIVHPQHVELNDRGGLGWLTGFNEWLVRCGVAFAGHPAKDGDHLLTLHGRIGNIPASEVEVSVDSAPPHRICVRGRVDECMFKFFDFELWTEVSTVPGSDQIRIKDTIVNRSDYEREYQIVYHTNFGPGTSEVPLLEAGASFVAPVAKVAPFNEAAAAEIDSWQAYRGPTRDYGETVYCVIPKADAAGRTVVALVNAAADRGVALRYDTSSLPAFTLWKNTDTVKEGYVTGLEPGSSFCYPRAVERAAGRVPKLGPGEQVSFQLDWHILRDAAAVETIKREVAQIQSGKKPEVCRTPVFYDPYIKFDPRI
eukprot:gnl/TRDRNA2_/TRDRNA2_89864_c0_seq1.p1 gnl/TRDRNA2_/TRDRNA2_89864_c0~~gnl/TRDRNA2_/TRDRNA2_89864_c0_seq1.p1  ORF type:complete len:475 (+),score=53.50 gnl/TRDRNA2_/TRDRNA2_89864_c0_seq1:92-1426(+)